MAQRGGKPTPTAIKLVLGNPGRRPINGAEPRATMPRPDVPGFLNADGVAEWDRISGELAGMGLLSGLDRGGLAAVCQAYGRWVQAERALALMKNDANGLVISTKAGNMIQNPLVGIANKAMSDYMRFAAEFGMTPSSRTRIAVGNGDDDPADKFFNWPDRGSTPTQ